ncbi:MAG TPA: hypothetical protein VKP30_09970, partial [Polyangiaceae bacterium]|nr:hypothetical protein [Polyangiaceae bacterium]
MAATSTIVGTPGAEDTRARVLVEAEEKKGIGVRALCDGRAYTQLTQQWASELSIPSAMTAWSARPSGLARISTRLDIQVTTVKLSGIWF